MLPTTPRLLPLLLLACSGPTEHELREVSISPLLNAEAAEEERPAPPTTPGEAYGAARAMSAPAERDQLHAVSTGMVPLSATQDPTSARFVKRGGRYEVTAGSGKDKFTWVIEPVPGDGLLDAVHIEDDGGVVRPFSGAVGSGLGQLEVLDQRRVGDSLEVTYSNDMTQVFTPFGRSLRIDLRRGGGPRRGRLEFKTGGLLAREDAAIMDVLRVPYFDVAFVAAVEVDREVRYLTSWLDPMVSQGTQILAANPDDEGPRGTRGFGQNVRYKVGTSTRRRPLRETIWLTWGTGLEEVLPSMDRPAAPERDTLHEHYYISYANSPFDQATADLETVYGLGVERAHVWMRQWQKDGFDEGYPNEVFPPRRLWGGLDGLQEMSRRVHALGFAMGLHHNWRFNTVKIPGYSLLDGRGRPQLKTGEAEYLKPHRALELVDEVEGQLHDEIGTTGTYTDSITVGYPPVDLDTETEDWGLVGAPLAIYHELIGRLRSIHGSPVAGEGGLGGGNVLYAGGIDAMPGTLFVTAQPRATGRNGRHVDLLPQFALGAIHDLSVRAGMGPPRRFTSPDRWTMAGGFTQLERDMLHTVSALFGNAGYQWWYHMTRPGSVARDWWGGRETVMALGRPGLELTDVGYVDRDGKERGLEAHLLAGGDLSIDDARLHLTYGDGGELWANMTPAPWRPKGRTETVAPMGHLYVRGDVAAGILVQDGSTVQVSASPERRWLDARGATATSDGLTTDGAAGLLPIDELDGAGWHLFPIDTFTLAIHAGQDEETASTTFVQLDAPLVTPGPHQLVFLDELRLELHGEEREVGPEGLRIELAELARHGALSVRIQPLD